MPPGRALLLASVLIAGLLIVSCASKPGVAPAVEAPLPPAELPASTEPPPAVGQAPQPAVEGTAINLTAKPRDAPLRSDRAAIEEALVIGSPESLQRARAMLSSLSNLKADEAVALGIVLNVTESLVYGLDDATKAVGGVPASLGGASALLAKTAIDAFGGRVGDVPPDYEVSGLGDLLPILAMFASSSRDTARQAEEPLARFEALGIASVIPDLALGLDAERRLDWKSALRRYRDALDTAHDAWPARIGSGRALLALGRPAEALATLEPLAETRSGSMDFVRPYAEALYENGRFAQADGLVSRVLVDDPQNSHFILIRAHLLVRGRAFQQAVPLLDAFATVDASNRLFLLLRCQVSEGMRDREDALRWARRGLAAYPDDPELLVAASRLLFGGPAAGKDEARSLAARAYELTPPDRGDEGLSPVLLEGRNAAGFEAASLLTADSASRFAWVAAAKYLERATAYGNLDDRALAAKVLRRSGNTAAALDYASAWYRDRPESESAAEAYLRCLVDSGNQRAAQDLVARLLQTKVSGAFRSFLHYLQSTMQKTEDAALALLRSALVENANNQEALAALCDIQVRRNDLAKARFYIRQALAVTPDDPDLLQKQKEIEAAAGP